MYALSSDREYLFQVVLVANSLPALNDVTAMELPDIVAEAAKVLFFPANRKLGIQHVRPALHTYLISLAIL